MKVKSSFNGVQLMFGPMSAFSHDFIPLIDEIDTFEEEDFGLLSCAEPTTTSLWTVGSSSG